MRILGFAASVILAATILLSTGAVAGARDFGGPRAATFAAAKSSGTVTLRIKIPTKPVAKALRTSSRLRPLYISVSTLSVAVLTDGKNPVIANVAQGFVTVVTHAVAGTHTFTVIAYDAYNGRGNVLSSGTTAPVVVPPNGEVRVALTLDGVVARVILTLDQSQVTIGSRASVPLEITAQDADGNTLLEGTAFTQALTLKSSDPLDGTLSQTTFSQSIAGVRVAYDGARVSPITISVTGPGLMAVTTATLDPLPAPPAGDQLIVTGTDRYIQSPNAAFATSGTNQLLATFGMPPPQPYQYYGDAAADVSTGRVYVVDYSFKNNSGGSYLASSIDVFQASGTYPLVESFQPSFTAQSIAIDSAAKIMYVSDADKLGIYLLSTATGHPSLGKFSESNTGELVLDPATHRLFVSNFLGLTAYSTVAPYKKLAVLADRTVGPIAVDSVAGKLYAPIPDYDDDYANIDVFDTLSFKQVAHIGPFASTPALAVSSSNHRLYASFAQASRANPTTPYTPYTFIVKVLETDTARYRTVGSFTTNGYASTIAPYTP